MTDLTRWRLVCVLGGVLALAGYVVRDLRWPPGLVHWTLLLVPFGIGTGLLGVTGSMRALRARKINVASKD